MNLQRWSAAWVSLLILCPLTAVRAQTAPMRLTGGWRLQDVRRVSSGGDVVSRPGYTPTGWYRAVVPGTVLTSLVHDGVYPEPLYGENNRPDKIPDSLCRTSYWYRTLLTVPRAYAGRRVWLRFEGINYRADVWVDGHLVGHIQGAFARGNFDVTPWVAVGGANAVAVLVHPQPHPGVPQEQTQAAGVGKNGGDTARDGPTFLSAMGWDWIPGIRDRDTGLWQDVSLAATGPVVVQDPLITTTLPLPRTDTADVTVQATLRNLTPRPQEGVLSGVFGGVTFRRRVRLGPAQTQTLTFRPSTTPALHLTRPRLWWPNGYGPQNLYDCRLRFTLAEGGVSDGQDVTFGVRQITYSVAGSDNLTLAVNGVPVVAKGGDWGMDEALKRVSPARIDAQVRLHQLAHYTLIRNWVGQSTSEALYRACDKYGLLLWDEFFQPNPADGPDPDDVGVYLANVREKLLRFRNHPSIALWCARNEGDPPPAIDRGIRALIDQLEPQRLYQPSSTAGRGVRSGGPYFWQNPRDYYRVDAPFKTEIGSVSVPTLEAVQAMMPPRDWNVINDDWAEHDLAGGAQGGDWYPGVLASRYGYPAGLPDFVRKAQLANFEAFRAMYEGRFAQLFHPTTGVITWMSNPAQPSFVWQLYSHDLEPNASLYGARKACEPIHIQWNQGGDQAGHVMVINNTPRALTALAARVAVYNLDGSLGYAHAATVTAAPSAATDLGGVSFPEHLSPVHFIALELRDARGRLLSDNFYWRADPAHPDDLTPLNELPMVALTARATRRTRGGRCLIDVVLHNPTRAVALLAHVQLRRARSGRRVLPVFYSDNYVSLRPGERRTLTIEAAVSDLGGDVPLLAVDGWNVTVRPTGGAGTSVRIVPNAAAIVRNGPTVEATDIVNIDCGGSGARPFRFGAPPAGGFDPDRDVQGGNVASTEAAIATDVPHAAPMAIYQTERWGPCGYAVPVRPGRLYTVRLHFAESKFAPGGRRFHVAINGRRVLTDFDIAAAGGMNRAVVREFPGITPGADGRIVIDLRPGSADQPKICGLQIIPQE